MITALYPCPLRTVVKHEYVGASRYTGYQAKSIRLHFDCGHEWTRKASAGVPKRARCFECGKAASATNRETAP